MQSPSFCWQHAIKSRGILINVHNHLNGPKHMKVVEDAVIAAKQLARTSRRGRPTRSSTTSTHSNQSDLHSLFSSYSQQSQQGECGSPDMEPLRSLMCCGIHGPNVKYVGLSYVMTTIIQDPHVGEQW